LESGYTYYMPYVIYDDDILNRPLDYSISSETIYETDQIFYGKKDSIVSNPITCDAELNGNTLKLKGCFYTELEEDIEEYGICYSMDDKEITIENSSVLKANSHQDGNYEVSINQNDDFYYRAYIKVKDKYYYGEIKKHIVLKVYRLSNFNYRYDLYIVLYDSNYIFYRDSKRAWASVPLDVYIFSSNMTMNIHDHYESDVWEYWELHKSTENEIVIHVKSYFKLIHDKDWFDSYTRVYDEQLIKRAEYTIMYSAENWFGVEIK